MEVVQLPNDVMLAIFAYLDSSDCLAVDMACPRFHNLMKIVWGGMKSLNLRKSRLGTQWEISSIANGILKRCNPLVLNVVCIRDSHLTPDMLFTIFSCQLTLLDLEGCVLDNICEAELPGILRSSSAANGFAALSLVCSAARQSQHEASGSWCISGLKNLNLSRCTIPAPLFRRILMTSVSLVEGNLSLASLSRTTTDNQHLYGPLNLCHMRKLETMHISGANFPFAYFQSFPSQTLTKLCLVGCLSDAHVYKLENLHNLEILDISRCNRLFDWAVISLSKLPKLTTLLCCHCQNLTGKFLKSLLLVCAHLKAVGLAHCESVFPAILEEISDCLSEERGLLLYLKDSGAFISSMFSTAWIDVAITINLSECCEHHCAICP